MEDQTQYTRCPHCDTAFKVTDKMLSIAQGKVRCGACLAVFQAKEHLLKPTARIQSDIQTSAVGSATIQKDLVEIDPVTTIKDDISETEAETPSITENSLSSEEEDENLDDIDSKEKLLEKDTTITDESLSLFEFGEDVAVNETDEPEIGDIDELPSDSNWLVSDTNKTVEDSSSDDPIFSQSETDDLIDVAPEIKHTDTSKETKASTQNDPQIDLTEFDEPLEEDIDELFEPEQALTDDFNEDDLTGSDINHADYQEVDAFTTAESFKSNLEEVDSVDTQTRPVCDKGVSLQDFIEDSGKDWSESELETSEPGEQGIKSVKKNTGNTEYPDLDNIDAGLLADNLTTQIEDGDIDLDPLDEFEKIVAHKRNGFRNTLIASAVSILLVIGGYNFWVNRQQLAWDDSWGGLTRLACSLLPCDLQPRRDIRKIRIRQHLVTPVEDNEDLLDIKLLLINQASFAQPFPSITINFSNSNGIQVASKRFTVDEYFPEKKSTPMPVGTEVHLSFQIPLLHPDALGFEFVLE